jgi:quinolinate synthase
VPEAFTAEALHLYRKDKPDIYVLAHPECPPEVLMDDTLAEATVVDAIINAYTRE